MSLIKFFPFKFFLKSVNVFITGKINYYKPNLDLFQGMSLYGLLKKMGTSNKKIGIINMIVEAYAYPNIKKISAAIVIPFSIKLIMNGMLNRSVVLSGGTSQIIVALKKVILSTKRVTIKTSMAVSKIKIGKVMLENGQNIKYDKLVIATRPSADMAKSIISTKTERAKVEYTHYDFITIKLIKPAEINGQSEWFGAYAATAERDISKPHFSSFLKLSAVTDISDKYIGGYLKWPNDVTPKDFKETRKIVKILVGKNLGIDVDKICDIQRWKFAMPNLSIAEIKRYRKLQGRNNIWFSGDYLGLPSMDMAVYTGRIAAESILKDNMIK